MPPKRISEAIADVVAAQFGKTHDKPSANVTVEVYRTINSEWSWRMKGLNGQIICSPCESFKRKSGALKNLNRVIMAREFVLKYV